MTVTVKFFASLRERVGKGEVRLELSGETSAAEVWDKATAGVAMPENILIAVNMEYADGGQRVHDGDEVAFFPPVTGGAA